MRTPSPTWARASVVAACLLGATLLGACASGSVKPGNPASGGTIRVIAAENFWGSIATQLGGDKATVTSIISNPATDPHDYEPTVADGRQVATANMVIYNGIGYDSWAPKLVAANPYVGRAVLDVGQIAGVPAGGNPHQWYSPAVVEKVIGRITAEYQRLDPANAAYFASRQRSFESSGLADYHSLITAIRTRYAGTPIGASESIVAPLAQALGLKMLTPPTFLSAISEGTGPTAGDKAAVDAQIRSKAIKIFIYNRQNSTPDVLALVNEARAQGIPVVTVTETLEPAGADFQDWQSSQLRAIQAALHKATGR